MAMWEISSEKYKQFVKKKFGFILKFSHSSKKKKIEREKEKETCPWKMLSEDIVSIFSKEIIIQISFRFLWRWHTTINIFQ